MELKVFSIRDEKSKVFSRPFFAVSNGIAIRDFSDLALDQQSTVSKHPGDFKLYLVASFDDYSGAFVSCPQPEFLCCASDFINDNVKKG